MGTHPATHEQPRLLIQKQTAIQKRLNRKKNRTTKHRALIQKNPRNRPLMQSCNILQLNKHQDAVK
jgi:hypothetical protein